MNRPKKLSAVLIEIGAGLLRAQPSGETSCLECPLEREPSGLIREECAARVAARLREFLGPTPRGRRRQAWCAVGARGVSLRRLTLPAHVRENLRPILAMQIETEFPLPPRELAWGYMVAPDTPSAAAAKEYLVAAVKREVLASYESMLAAADLEPVFTLNAVALAEIIPDGRRACAVLNVGEVESEWITLEDGRPTAVRAVPWGESDWIDACAAGLSIGRDEARERLREDRRSEEFQDERERAFEDAARASLAPALDSLLREWTGHDLWVAGAANTPSRLINILAPLLPEQTSCRPLQISARETGSTVLHALRRGAAARNGTPFPLLLQCQDAPGESRSASMPAFRKWAVLAALLVLALLSLRYVEPILDQPRLERSIAEMQSAWDRRPDIDRELAFLQYLQTNQPPFLAVLAVLADAAARGTKLDSLTLNRRGEMSLKGAMPDSKLAGDFRSKLIDSGWFSTVVLEEQTPMENQKKVNVRLSGRWRKALPSREAPAAGPPDSPRDEPDAPSTDPSSVASAAESESTLSP